MSFFNSIFGSGRKENDSIKILGVADFKTAITQENIQLIDVRTPREYQSGHIKNAVNLDFFDRANFQEKVGDMDKEKPVYLYCRSGNRSQKAAHLMADMGFQEIYDLKGGYNSWQ